MTLTARRAASLVTIVSVAVTACGSPDDDATPPAELLATTTVWADITSNVACGEPVDSLIIAGADPHAFEPSLRDRERLDDATLVIANGADLEESLLDLLTTVSRDGVDVVEMASHVELLAGSHSHGGDDNHDDDDHEHDDPHLWLDPGRVIDTLDVIAASLVEHGRDQATIESCVAAYRDELTAIDTEIAGLTAAMPAENRVLVTNHDELTYFADRYGFDVVGTVLPSTSSIAETDAATLDALADTIRERDVPAIFVESSESSADAEALGDRLDVPVVAIQTASLSNDGPASTYTGMLRTMTTAITEALAP